ncbi:TRAP transporter substrate-binding protein [uncultured Mailhella sp.]|uniref:TRAP transporter substrate-binding protein n=1 Tax=uncultured Mailhella sp. TaxID=1981031 RepID=UPI002617ABE1|nr:TRAP transporter substrate-binding protein [uncultured Mailhella sp.]
MKKLVAFSLAMGLIFGATAMVGTAQAAKVIKIAGMKAEGEPETIGMHKFGEYLEKLSNGKYQVKVYPNSTLGKEDKYIADTRRGTVEMNATGTQVASFHPAMAMMETPMMYDSYAHAHRAINGGVFDLLTKGFTEKSGLRCLSMFPLGFRHFYTKNPVKTIDDVKGLKLRVPNITLYTTFAKNCGINGQAMPFAEVMSSVDQGVIDGGDSPFSDITSTKVYEKCPNITMTGHILVIHALFINEKLYQSLPDQDKAWFNEAAQKAAEDVWQLVEELDKTAIAEIEKNGGKVSEATPEMKAHMLEAAHRTWELFKDPNTPTMYVPNADEIFAKAESFK